MEEEEEISQEEDEIESPKNLLIKSNNTFAKHRPHLEIRPSRFELEEPEEKEEEQVLKASPEVSYWKKKFIRSVRMVIFCYKWCKWATQNYNRIIHRFISFSQIVDTEDRTLKILKELDFKNKEDGDSKLAQNAKIRAEMMNFDVDFFKPTQRLNSRLDEEIKQILSIDNKSRSKADIEHLIYTFKKMPHMKCINDLLPESQRKFFRLAWLEEYKPRRIIVSQDRRPECFYIIVHGSLVSTYRPKSERKSHTVCFLDKGMTFGDLALLSDSMHTSSVTTREEVQLLAVNKQDFFDIFVNASKDSSNSNSLMAFTASMKLISQEEIQQDSEINSAKANKNSALMENVEFLKEISFLNSWPLGVFMEKPKLLKQCRFPKGKIISFDTSVSKYIYVIKSGSLSVWIKVKAFEQPESDRSGNSFSGTKSLSTRSNELEFKQSEASLFATNYFLEDHHLEILGVGDQQKEKSETEKIRDLESKLRFNQIMKYLANVKKVDAEASQESESSQSKRVIAKTARTVTKHSWRSLNLPKLENNKNLLYLSNSNRLKLEQETKSDFKLPELVHSSYFNLKNQRQNKSDVKINRASKHATTTTNTAYYQTKTLKLNDSQRSNNRPVKHLNWSDCRDLSLNQNESNNKENLEESLILTKTDFNDSDLGGMQRSEYLLLKKLNTGDYFGLTDILFNAQPSMQLISNGCECILMPKDFFIENSSIDYLRQLRRTEEPYPKLEDIQDSYDSNLSWKKFTRQILHRQLLSAKRHKPHTNKINV